MTAQDFHKARFQFLLVRWSVGQSTYVALIPSVRELSLAFGAHAVDMRQVFGQSWILYDASLHKEIPYMSSEH